MRFFLISFLFVSIAAHSAQTSSGSSSSSATGVGQESIEQTLKTRIKPPQWKTSVNSYYFDFEGTRAQKDGLYEFGDITLKLQTMALSYQMDNGWNLVMVAQYLENYVVTRFPAFGIESQDTARGLGDTLVSGSKMILMDGSFMLLGDIGLSLPTGSIDEMNPSRPNERYPYNMQMGSGTVDTVGGLTALFLRPSYQAGGRVAAWIRNGEKTDNGYRLGNMYRLDTWFDVPTRSGFTPRLTGFYRYKDAINGFDQTLGRIPFLEFYHHSQINWDISAALKYAYNFSPTLALNAEAGVPVAQDAQNFDNVMVSTQYFLNLGISGQF